MKPIGAPDEVGQKTRERSQLQFLCANGIIALETTESYNESCVCDDRHTESMAVAYYRDLPDIP